MSNGYNGYIVNNNIAGPPRTRIAFAEKAAHGVLIAAGVLAGPMWILGNYTPLYSMKKGWGSGSVIFISGSISGLILNFPYVQSFFNLHLNSRINTDPWFSFPFPLLSVKIFVLLIWAIFVLLIYLPSRISGTDYWIKLSSILDIYSLS